MPTDPTREGVSATALVKGDGETWEAYAHRLEHRIKQQRDQLRAIQALREGPQRAARQRKSRTAPW